VRRSFEEFRVKTHDDYLAMVAVTFANVMAERMWHHYEGTARVHGASNEKEYREALAAKYCGDFSLVRDVADGFKHFKLTRRLKTRRVSFAEQTASKPVCIINDASEELMVTNDGGEKVTVRSDVIVELDDGSMRPLLPLLQKVVEMWDRLSVP